MAKTPPDEELRTITASSITEVSFILLPFGILLIISLYQNGWSKVADIFSAAEWSFTAVILSGQTVVKFVPFFMSNKTRLNQGWATALLAILLVGIIVPSVIVLVLVLLSTPHVPIELIISQLTLFCLSLIAFLLPERIKYVVSRHDPETS